jgi:hypothetical protein
MAGPMLLPPSSHRLAAGSAAFRLVGCSLLTAILVGETPAWATDPAGGITEQALAPRSGPRGPTMFTELSAAQTGIVTTNDYTDPRMWGDLYQEFEGGAMGTGVAIGDYDGDGKPDVFVVSKTESCRLFRNLGNWRFEDVTEKAGVGDQGVAAAVWKQGATFADVNNDGLLDIYVCRFRAPNLLYINQGDGTFREMAHAYGLDLSDASVMAAFCDYDRDGWLDVAVATNPLNYAEHKIGRANHLFHNHHDGTFTNVTERAGIADEGQAHSATWWDFDNDGWPDLYIANDFFVPDRLYHNNRDGTFTDVISRVVPHVPFSSMGSDLGDLNNDGLIDFFASDMAASTHEKDQRGMADSRSRTTEDDRNPRLVPQYERSAVFLNTGTGHCLEAAFLAGLEATDWTWSPRLEDLDNDGRLDLFCTNGMIREATNVDIMARQRSTESVAEHVRVLRDSPVMAEAHFAFRNRGDLVFENVGPAWGLSQKGVSFGSAFGDLDGDGDLDVIHTNYLKGVTILRNDCDTGHRVIVDLRGTRSNRFGVGATVRIESTSGPQIRQLVLARGVLSSSEPMVHFGLGEDPLVNKMTVTWPSGQVQTFANLAVDRRFTITEPSTPAPASDPEVPRRSGQFAEVSQSAGLALSSHEEAVDETSVQPLLPMRLNRRGPGLAVGSLEGGSAELVAVGGTTLSRATILIGRSVGPFAAIDTSAVLPVGGADDGPLLFFDADGDGKDDLLVTKGGNALPAGAPEYQPRLYLGDGRGGFRPAPDNALPSLLISTGAVAAADFDHSGRLGLFIGARVLPGQYPLPPSSALLANRGGRFEDVTDSLAPGLREVGMVTAALWSDVDGDGWPDLLLTLEWGTVRFFHNNQGKGFDDWSERAGFAAAGTGWWTSISAADFNEDGRPDYVVGNVGLNTQYHASPERPALLFTGDFNGRGEEPALIEAYYEGDRLYPWRCRKDLGGVVPSVFKRFPKNNAYARATLGEILVADKLAKAQRFAATELRSGVFLSQPDGTYHFEPLPRLAQISPLQGIAAGDFDGDGQADIYAVQNSFAPIPLVGRFDGGLSQLLRGDGHGHFTLMPPAESGLVVPGDAKALAVVDLDRDGWPDFVITRNNDTTLAFRNNGMPGRHSLRVVLRAPTGNPTAVGARITVELADGSTQTSEVYAGSGYYSQSTAACFFGYPEANPPKLIRVRWPSGATTEHAFPRNSVSLTLAAPTQ